MKKFSDKDPVEKVFVSFDFSKVIVDAEEVITAATFTITEQSGADPILTPMLTGTPALQTKVASQLLEGGISGLTYIIKCVVTTSKNQVFKGSGLLTVIDQ